MKMYLPFGDWSNDGHGRYEKILIEAPSMGSLFEAQKRIKEKYGFAFFSENFASNYCSPYIGDEVWQALIDTNYPIERFIDCQDDRNLEELNSFQEIIDMPDYIDLNLKTIIDIFIWLLNAFGAEINQIEDYPMICNWTCHGFETVGYGCFD